jgi:hypothetical protein
MARKNWIPACAGMTKRDLMMERGDFEIGSEEVTSLLARHKFLFLLSAFPWP